MQVMAGQGMLNFHLIPVTGAYRRPARTGDRPGLRGIPKHFGTIHHPGAFAEKSKPFKINIPCPLFVPEFLPDTNEWW